MRFVPEIALWLLHKLRGTQVYSVSHQKPIETVEKLYFKKSFKR